MRILGSKSDRRVSVLHVTGPEFPDGVITVSIVLDEARLKAYFHQATGHRAECANMAGNIMLRG
ncbi:hypothetical protein N7471_010474 [Penicillium samsonianum]|uniref:uncharacterized protein n=1 Tax=Penicillium samsonianum TaxID=1882272 RepID=UPI0025496594|nr:uncharacterized protein N7471_010474 [Penicillium samsonianum]KAJ6125981.1 hypothetical protein N7471_010474 [Penicillium samsonianum]